MNRGVPERILQIASIGEADEVTVEQEGLAASGGHQNKCAKDPRWTLRCGAAARGSPAERDLMVHSLESDCGVVYGVQIMRSSMPLFMVTVVGNGPVTSKWILPVDWAPSGMVAPLMLAGLATCHSTR